MRILLISLGIIYITLAGSARAAIIDLGNITRDTGTGLEWLDLTETLAAHRTDIKMRLLSGGDLYGWRYATSSELDQLLVNFGYVAINSVCSGGVLHCDVNIGGDSTIVETIIKTLGDTGDAYYDSINFPRDTPSDGAFVARGFIADLKKANNSVYHATSGEILDGELVHRDSGLPSDDVSDTVATYWGIWEFQVAQSPTMGHFLIRSYAVPLPATAWLFISALGGLITAKRMKALRLSLLHYLLLKHNTQSLRLRLTE